MRIEFETFKADCSDKEQAVKVLEEAAEVFSAWEQVDDEWLVATCGFRVMERLGDEIADVIMAACNLAERFDIDVGEHMHRCVRKNRERGRYEQQEIH